jgi:hypothetical protein
MQLLLIAEFPEHSYSTAENITAKPYALPW